ncbi:MAG TPA: hypothetical protein VD772_13175 [Anseongella sp.]|nr:hypothetical protein [Anseongella sp.]
MLFESGNQMPSPGLQRAPGKGVKRQLLVYDLIRQDELEGEGNGFYREPPDPPLKTASSNADGSFRIQLDPGKYTLFVREKGKLYANRSDGDGNIFPVEVKRGEISVVEFRISYDAYY